MHRLIGIVLVVVLISAGCHSVTPPPPAPLEIPQGYVATPHGLVHQTCVREIRSGERVDASGTVTRPDGNREQLKPCEHPRLHPRTLRAVTPDAGASPKAINGWVEAAIFTSSTPLGSLSTDFTVPPPPSRSGATIYFFPGAQSSSPSTILQPVLQYGPGPAGGGNYWAASSWYCCPAGWSHYSPLMRVSAGDTLRGTMTSSCSGSSCNWTIVTTSLTSGASTTLPADNVTTPFLWIYGGALEAYKVGDCSQFPAARGTTFRKIVVQDQTGKRLQPVWDDWVAGGTPACGYDVRTTPTSATLAY